MKNPTVVFTEPHKAIIEEKPMPEPGEGEVLVRMSHTLISTGTELTILNGEFPEDSAWSRYGKFPFSPGYDGVGTVTSVGAGVDEALMGKTVAGHFPHAAHAVLSVEDVHILPEGVAPEEAVFITLAQIVFNGVRRGKPLWGEAAAVFGCGLLGQIAVRVLDFAGMLPVFAVDIAPYRLGLLPKSKTVVPVDAKQKNAKEAVSEGTSGKMADLAYEVTGNPSLIPSEFEVLRPGGRMVMLSSPRGATEFDFHDYCNAPSYTIIGAHNSSHPPSATMENPWTLQRDAQLFFDMVKQNIIDIKGLISHIEHFIKAPELYQSLLKDRSRAMGVILEWD